MKKINWKIVGIFLLGFSIGVAMMYIVDTIAAVLMLQDACLNSYVQTINEANPPTIILR